MDKLAPCTKADLPSNSGRHKKSVSVCSNRETNANDSNELSADQCCRAPTRSHCVTECRSSNYEEDDANKFTATENECEEDEESEKFMKNINGIILQYLESCGLVESYTTFFDECKQSNMRIPSNYSAEIESGISLQDVETLLVHFDQENGDALLELWEVLISMVNTGQNSQEVEKITFYIQIYIALIPYRQKQSEETKTRSMTKLREYFQSKSEACTMDKEMLSLFALPFVPDPEAHPVFGNLFQVAWIKKLRSRIKHLARVLCSPNKLITRDDTDLSKMFKICSQAIPHEIESTEGNKFCIFANVKPISFTSSVDIQTPSSHSGEHSSEFSPSQLFRRMNDLILENERFKAEESKYEKQCSQLLNVSILLAQSLEDAAQGREVNMDNLRHEISQCLPVSMNKEESDKKSCETTSAKENAYQYDGSSPIPTDDDEDLLK
ncbi:unnamed protein product [Orchesella dallaii]|uniref:ARMC9 CTLH-like domain-containing protein n=1 Tax=Orchesella dallaii TaxID=48710 RepID=A0ABP1QRM1_9HEXA